MSGVVVVVVAAALAVVAVVAAVDSRGSSVDALGQLPRWMLLLMARVVNAVSTPSAGRAPHWRMAARAEILPTFGCQLVL